MIILRGRAKEILRQILDSRGEEVFFIKTKVGKRILYTLLEFTKVREIIFSKGVYRQIPKRYIEAIKKTGVRVKVEDLKRGRKEVHPWKEVEPLLEKMSVREVHARTGIPLRTLYQRKRMIMGQKEKKAMSKKEMQAKDADFH